MTDIFELNAEKRADIGKGASRRLRRLQDKIPGILYGGEKEPVAITLEHNQVLKALENEAFYSHVLTINVDGKAEKAVLKDVQRHAFKPKVTHMDFQRVSAKSKLHMHVPLHFINEAIAPGVKTGGGMVNHLLTDVEVICLPNDLPEYIEVDLSGLQVNQAIHLSELKLPKGVELVALSHDHDLSVVNIQLPRAAVAEEAAAASTEAAEASKS
ncbi:MAG: rplY [Gammaproteobacteria bacterium]|jgi:large subunit ribosomal protein L25|nr:rplY [Gammaproteobacteria bacterium]